MFAVPREASPSKSPAPVRHPIRELVAGGAAVAPDERVKDVAERFFQNAELDAVAVVDASRPVGLLTRARLLFKLGRNFGYELFARKPVIRIADPAPLVVRGSTDVAEAVAEALARPGESVYDEVIVVDEDGAYLGLLSVRQLAHQQGYALARSVVEVEDALARAREIERLERMRAQFLAHATHELRSPVNAIVGLGELLRMAAAKGAWDEVHGRLGQLLQTAVALRGTVNEILDLSKLEAGRMQVFRARVELAPLLEEVAAMTRVLVGAKDVVVTVALEGAAPPLTTDRLKLRQVLVNLAGNAAKFTERGRIVLGARAASGGGATLWVEDSGIGIRPEDLARLFVAFGQLEDAQTKSYEGTGLGLVITRSLVELLGGRVVVESRYGEGTRFTVHHPGGDETS